MRTISRFTCETHYFWRSNVSIEQNGNEEEQENPQEHENQVEKWKQIRGNNYENNRELYKIVTIPDIEEF